MKSIKSQITAVILAFVVGLCTILGIITSVLNYRAVTSVLQDGLGETAKSAASHVEAEIRVAQSIAYETGCVARLASTATSNAQKRDIIEQRAKTHGFLGSNIVDTTGKSIFNGKDISGEGYIKDALDGRLGISDLIINEETKEKKFIVSAPIWKGGIPNTSVIGVVYFELSDRFLNTVVNSIEIGENGKAYILNKAGTTVAHIDPELVGVQNVTEQAKTDSSLKGLAEIEKNMVAQKIGSQKCTYDGKSMVVAYAPISGSGGMSVGILVPQKDYMTQFYVSIFATALFTVIFGVIGVISAVRFGNKIGKPIKQCTDRLELLVEGDLTSEIPVINTKDETAILANATAQLTLEYSKIVNEISDALKNIAKGNFDIEELPAYKGDFLPLSNAANQIVASLSQDITQINMVADQVASGSEQVSSGSQALSQGATEQASSIQELSATISVINDKIKHSAEIANEANTIVTDTKQKLNQSNSEMKQMLLAMDEIEKSSKEIANIIKTIDDIAFQTNILALNAAVEAARAGSAGKGFAVVADEVRNLASKSAEAAKNTTSLIENAVNAVDKGKKLADKTAQNLINAMQESEKSANYVNEIADGSAEQAVSVFQVNEGIEQISAVVQTNSATAEQSAATSEELSSQAHMLKTLIARFRVKDGENHIQWEDEQLPSEEEYLEEDDLENLDTSKY